MPQSNSMPQGETAINGYVDRICIHKDLLVKFFVVFSRFEYALKRTGYCFPDRNSIATPDWKKFSQECCALSQDDLSRLNEAGKYLLEFPPKQQVYANNVLSFAAVAWEKEPHPAAKLIRYVKIVRNNLFHGGKYPGEPVEDVSRNKDLLASCLGVLLFFLTTNRRICETFLETD